MKKIVLLFMAFVFQLSVMGQTYSEDLEQNAQDGDPTAMFLLSLCYLNGDGVAQNDVLFLEWLQKAVDKDEPDAWACLGDCYVDGFYVDQDYKLAVDCFKGAISLGSAAGMNSLGDCYYYGHGVEQDFEQAVKWYRKAAENGDVDGMTNVGFCYDNGDGVEQDYKIAAEWYGKAINEDGGDACAHIGMWYYEGTGMDQDYVEAVTYFIAAIGNGSQLGYDYLSECYEHGYGVPKNKKKAQVLREGSAAMEDGDDDLALELAESVVLEEEIGQGIRYAEAETEAETEVETEDNAVTASNSSRNLVSMVGPVSKNRDQAPAQPKEEEPETVADVEEESDGEQVSDVDQDIPRLARVNENTFAVIIANENYQTESKVDYAINDGKTFKTYCQNVLGIPESNIRIVTDATLNNIRGQVDWLHKVAEAYKGEATLIFYYAGHGVPDVKSKEAYLLPVDGYASSLITGFRLNDLYTTLAECPSRSTLVFLDACFSGSQRSGEQMKSARAVGIRAKNGTPRGNMVVFSAAQGNETAFPYKEHQHGMFTYYLLKKLKETHGDVTLGDLGSYIIDNVQRKSVVLHTESQTPSVNASSKMADEWKDMPLVK